MIETLHPSVLDGILYELPPADSVRLATCAKSLHRHIMFAASLKAKIPILRERLKVACWSLVHAGYCVHIRNTLASYISCANLSMAVTYNEQMLHLGDITDGHAALERIECHHRATVQILVDDIKTFGEVFDRFIIHANARLQRSKRPENPNREIERRFARCAEQLHSLSDPATQSYRASS